MSDDGPEIIGREILRLRAELQRDGDRMGKTRRQATTTRLDALEWALHAALTGDRTKTTGPEVEAFLGALTASDGTA